MDQVRRAIERRAPHRRPTARLAAPPVPLLPPAGGRAERAAAAGLGAAVATPAPAPRVASRVRRVSSRIRSSAPTAATAGCLVVGARRCAGAAGAIGWVVAASGGDDEPSDQPPAVISDGGDDGEPATRRMTPTARHESHHRRRRRRRPPRPPGDATPPAATTTAPTARTTTTHRSARPPRAPRSARPRRRPRRTHDDDGDRRRTTTTDGPPRTTATSEPQADDTTTRTTAAVTARLSDDDTLPPDVAQAFGGLTPRPVRSWWSDVAAESIAAQRRRTRTRTPGVCATARPSSSPTEWVDGRRRPRRVHRRRRAARRARHRRAGRLEPGDGSRQPGRDGQRRSEWGHDKIGTTVAVLRCRSGRVTVAHVGDTRIYRIRGAVVESLTSDHSVRGDLEAAGIRPANVAVTSSPAGRSHRLPRRRRRVATILRSQPRLCSRAIGSCCAPTASTVPSPPRTGRRLPSTTTCAGDGAALVGAAAPRRDPATTRRRSSPCSTWRRR